MASAKNAMKEPEKNPTTQGEAKKNPSGTPAGPNRPVATVHRSSTAKEIIPFEWKLIGESEGFALTLFKSIEREDVDAQFERVKRDGYYSNLRILGADDKVTQPASAKARKARQTAKVTKEVEASVKARLEAEAGAKAKKSAASKKTTKAPTKTKAVSTKTDATKTVKPKAKAKVKVKPKAKTKVKAKAKVKSKTKAKAKAKVKAKAKRKAPKKPATATKSKAKARKKR